MVFLSPTGGSNEIEIHTSTDTLSRPQTKKLLSGLTERIRECVRIEVIFDLRDLYPSNFEDKYLLNLQGYLNHLPPRDKKILSTAVNLWIRNLVIRNKGREDCLKLGIRRGVPDSAEPHQIVLVGKTGSCVMAALQDLDSLQGAYFLETVWFTGPRKDCDLVQAVHGCHSEAVEAVRESFGTWNAFIGGKEYVNGDYRFYGEPNDDIFL
ncbi:hypothetical protein Tco_1209736 [Tanacetum coccineum]